MSIIVKIVFKIRSRRLGIIVWSKGKGIDYRFVRWFWGLRILFRGIVEGIRIVGDKIWVSVRWIRAKVFVRGDLCFY